jgi:uncharacterized membrane protein YedE/YeeE
METEFTPWMSLTGGILIGLSAILLMAFNGRIAGMGGLIVGAGVTYGSGCTSGHGVCGMARLSPRSIAATLTFMASPP